ncbi:hypothetical protein NLG97_g212 [Lecanicillium saksenae]|uniref:Uncharacterized protein n=1 Tax=Lecanicillium saksenae TaxID=468837 RepID=A0ACC1R8L7_9HYPO|nr:hypothetical protein NLG97_g212 [Lecanicillium saksenae]
MQEAHDRELPPAHKENPCDSGCAIQNEESQDMPQKTDPDVKSHATKTKTLPTMVAVYLVFFLVALDRTIIGTAIPSISAEFNSFGDIAWYESAFLLPLCVLQLSFGLVLKYYSTKYTLFVLTAIFEIGSIVCASAPTSNALIIGRALTGIGAAGIAPGAYLMIILIIPLRDRPKYLGSLGSAFGISSILGPVLGGYLTSITWRWCFWINLPIGCTALGLLLLLAPNTPPPSPRGKTWKQKLWELDPFGFVLIAASISCLLFALELGGKDQKWTAGSAIALFVVFGVCFIGFAIFQFSMKDKSTLPPKIMGKRVVIVACLVSFCTGAAIVIYAFYLPVWFQVVQGKSPQGSGLSLLPLLLSNVISVVASGMLQPVIAIQTVLKEEEMPIGTSTLNFAVFLGGSILVTVAQTIFEQQLTRKLLSIEPNLDPSSLSSGSATSLKDLVPAAHQHEALAAYNDSMRAIWYLGLAVSAVAFLGSFGLGWRSVKNDGVAEGEDAGKYENAM